MSFVIRHCPLLLFLSSCAVGPNYNRPDVQPPPAFRNAAAQTDTNSLAELSWWEVFNDATLTNLVRTALTNNYDLRIALTRQDQAHALAIQARSELLPQAGYEGEASRGKNTILGNPNPLGQGNTANNFVGVLNASWEVDLWGRIRRLNEAARAQFLASEEARRDVTISLISGVAQAYFELLELDSELEIAERTTNSFAESLRIFNQRLEGGVVSKLESSRAEAALAFVAATVPDIERRIVIKENQINVLLGHNPGPVARSSTLLQQAMPAQVPPGLPSQLLERRPDIRETEQQARSANANVGVAIGNFLPRIGLTALYGGASTELSAITATSAGVWSVAANVSGPLFTGGRLYGQYKQAVAIWEEAKLRYEQTALNAFQEVADALISRQKFQGVRDQLALSVEAYRVAVEVSTQRYVAGKASYYEVLEAQQQLFPAETSLAQTDLNQRLAVVQLYKALGGGWTKE